MRPKIGPLDHQVEIQKKLTTTDPVYGTESVSWIPWAIVYAARQDKMPSADEDILQGALETHSQRIRIRMRWRNDVTSDMRIKILHPIERTCQIIGGPAEIGGRRQWIEIMCEDISTDE